MSASPPNSSPRLSSRIAEFLSQLALRRAPLILVGALVLIVAGALLGSKLALQTDLSELLPPEAASVVELKALNRRVGGTGSVAIALEGEPAALRVFIPKLVTALRADLGSNLLALKYQRKEIADYFTRFAAYYAPLPDLQRWSQKLHEVLSEEKAAANPAFVSLDDDPHAAARALIADVRSTQKQLGPKMASDDETGLLMAEEGHLGVIFLRPAANSFNLAASGVLLDRLRKIISDVGASESGVKLAGFTGSIPSALAEMDSVKRDIVGTAALVILLVGGVVALYFGGIRELLLMSVALLIGAATAFAFAYLWIGHVNAQTAFLGSIIVGTGINYGIILLARYTSLRREGATLERALPDAIGITLRATSIAACATAVSFGVLAAGTVESFHQFGWIGGIGILACWVATFTVVPAALVMFDRNRVYKPRRRVEPLVAICRAVTGWASAHSGLVLGICGVLSIVALGATYRRRNDALETNYNKLGTKSSRLHGMQKLDNRLRKMDNTSSSPAIIPTDDPEEAEEVCKVLRPIAKETHERCMGRCFTVRAALPGDLSERAPLIDRLRKDLSQVPSSALDGPDQKELEKLRHTLAERVPVATDLPPTIAEPFVERDGSMGKLAFVEPRHDEIQDNLYAFADSIRTITLPSGKVIHASGENVVFADVLRAVAKDAKRLTAAAAALVLLVLLLLTRRAGPFVRVSIALLTGVIWMLGAAALLGDKLNFFNFVALPTTFGIGIDYAINVDERLERRGSGSIADALAEIGPPVILASSTTILGYVTLLIADNQALASFGHLAILGEVTCLIAAIVLEPALWARRRG